METPLDYMSDTSSPLSSPPSSPVPPSDFYPSPPPTNDLEDSFISNAPSQEPPSSQNGSLGVKKRRKVEPKPRTTMHLDLTSRDEKSLAAQATQLDLLIKTLQKKRKIVVIAGAGISVSAGIPDFRSSHGLFKTLRKDHKLKASGKELFDASVYRDESMTSSFHEMVRSLSGMASSARPTLFHHFLARLAKDGRLMRLYTQNVDGIDTSLPPLATEVPLGVKAPWPRTIQLHGGLEKMVCQKCRHTADFQACLFEGPDPPLCPACRELDEVRTTTGHRSHGVGKLRPRIVLYNEHNPDEEAIGSVMTADLRSRPDALIVVGTSLKIPGVRRIVKEMSRVVRDRRDGVSMWINHDSVPVGKDFENCWDLVIKGDCDEVARQVNFRPWDDDSNDVTEYSSSDVERIQEQGRIRVVVPPPQTPQKHFNQNTGILTPGSSQDEAPGRIKKGPTARSLAGVLGKASKSDLKSKSKPGRPKNQPKKSAPKKSAPTKQQSKQIDFKVTKLRAPGRPSKKSVQAKQADVSKAMHPISPVAVQNNGPVSATDSKMDLSLPSDCKPVDQHPRNRGMSITDIINPAS